MSYMKDVNVNDIFFNKSHAPYVIQVVSIGHKYVHTNVLYVNTRRGNTSVQHSDRIKRDVFQRSVVQNGDYNKINAGNLIGKLFTKLDFNK